MMSQLIDTSLDTCGCCEPEEAQPPIYNRPGLPSLSYRIGVYASFLRRMLRGVGTYTLQDGDFAGTRPLEDLTTRALDDPAIALLDASAVMADVLTFYQARIANEGFLRTATERRSILELARAIGYELNPGVAATAYLAFMVEDAPGAPGVAEVPVGTRVQSIPPQGQLPQTFETAEALTVYKEWDALRPRLSRPQTLVPGINKLYLKGTASKLKPGDRLIVDAGGAQRLAYVIGAEEQAKQDRTVVVLDGSANPAFSSPSLPQGTVDINTQVALDQSAINTYIRGKQWADDELNAFLSFHKWDKKKLLAYLEHDRKENPSTSGSVYALRASAGIFGNNAPAYQSLPSGSSVTADYGRNWDTKGHLAVRYWDGAWHWADQGMPPGMTVIGAPSVITYMQSGSQRIYAFVRGANGHLYVNWWNGSSWQWADQGAPPGTTMTGAPSAITYAQSGTQRLYVFVRGANGRLYVNWWNGSSWQWTDLGAPSGAKLVGTPAAITYVQSSIQRIYVFVRGDNGRLYVRYWNGSSWQWADQGAPSGATVASSPSAITYAQSGTQRIYAFVRGANGHLYVNWWNGSIWSWANQGVPSGTSAGGAPSAITYLDGSSQRLYAFVRGANGRLYVNYWNGSVWQWANQGAPSGTTVTGQPSATTYAQSGTQRIYVFVQGSNGRLQVNWWDGSSWDWSDQSIPSPTTVASAPSVISYMQGGTPRIYVFVQTMSGWQVWMDQQAGDDADLNLYHHAGADLYLERVVQGLVRDTGAFPRSWAAFETPDDNEVFLIDAIAERSLGAFAMSGKATGLKLKNPDGSAIDKSPSFLVRSTMAYLQSEPLSLAEIPMSEALDVSPASLVLDGLVLGLAVGQVVALTGERSDMPGITARELLVISDINHAGGFTELTFETGRQYGYKRSTLSISANIARATHGETVREILGSGSGVLANQQFVLKKPPLTHTSAVTPSGSASTLDLRVNNLLWRGAPSLYGLGPSDEGYIIRIDDDGKAAVIFGDGEKGARLPTGENNVTAVYRSGIGLAGQVDAGSLTLLPIRPMGVRSVTNPLPASGAADPEKMADARANAPLTVRTLDRIVSRQDYEDFAAAFAGIGKAQAIDLWSGEHHLVHLTIAGADEQPVEDGDFRDNFIDALDKARDPAQLVRVDTFDRLLFNLSANVVLDDRYIKEEVFQAVTDALADAFSFPNRSFGQAVTAAEVITVIQNTEGIIYVDLDSLYLTSNSQALNQILPAGTAHVAGGIIQPAQLLLVNRLGIGLQEVST